MDSRFEKNLSIGLMSVADKLQRAFEKENLSNDINGIPILIVSSPKKRQDNQPQTYSEGFIGIIYVV